MTRRVVVTGMGCVTPAGSTVDSFAQSLYAARSGIAEHVFADLPEGRAPGLKFTRTAQVRDFAPDGLLTAAQLTGTERSGQFALAAAAQAVAQSCWTYPGDRTAVLLGCSTGGRTWEEPETAKLYLSNARVHPLTVIRSMASSGASQVAMAHGVTGPVLNLSTACASGTHALGMAFHMVRSGLVDAAIAGGHEAPLTFGFLRAWDSMRVVSPTQCRPFSSDRDGMTLGEGAAMLTLEDRASALARGAEILGEIAGFGMSSDASHITQPDPAGAARAMQAALADAGLTPDDIGYVNAHGTGTLANDAVEAEALRRVFGPRGVPVGATKSITGHSIGATGAIEALATLLALHQRSIPPTSGLEHPDESISLDLVMHQPRPLEHEYALSNSLAFGGLNAVLCLRR
jgi:3-oxoacyl-[acyl-carrier-protein] synthase II/nodulation protein E